MKIVRLVHSRWIVHHLKPSFNINTEMIDLRKAMR